MGTTGYKHTEESKRKMSETLKGRKHSEERKKNISDSMKGKKRSKHSEEAKKKMSDSHKGIKVKHKPRTKPNKPEDKITCPHCYKVGSQGNMKRYHFNNCKKLSKVLV